jgi:hypothetical protein
MDKRREAVRQSPISFAKPKTPYRTEMLLLVRERLGTEQSQEISMGIIDVFSDLLHLPKSSPTVLGSPQRISNADIREASGIVGAVEAIADQYRDAFPDLNAIGLTLEEITGHKLSPSGKEYFSYLQTAWLEFALDSQILELISSEKSNNLSDWTLKHLRERLGEIIFSSVDKNLAVLPSLPVISRRTGISQERFIGLLGRSYFIDLFDWWITEIGVQHIDFRIQNPAKSISRRVISRSEPVITSIVADSMTSESPFAQTSS